MRRFSHIATEELEAELARRKQPKPEPPKVRETPDFTALIAACVYFVESVANGSCDEVDGKLHIYEAALTAVYGEDVWEWKRALP